MNWTDRFEIEGGIDLTLAADPQREFNEYRASIQPDLGYRIGLNIHLIQKYRFDGLRSSLSVGISYGSTNFGLSDFRDVEEGVILGTDGSESEGTIRTINGRVTAKARSTGLQLLYRPEISDRFALLFGMLFLDSRSGEIRYERTYTDTHIYDPGRRVWVPAAEVTSFETQNLVTAASGLRLQAGLEYRNWLEGVYARLSFEIGGPNRFYKFRSGHLNLMLGYRL